MLAAIEQATRQKIAPMKLPSRQDIAERRVGLFKDQVFQAMQAQDLEFFEDLIDDFQQQYETEPRKIAAAMAYLLQKDRPLMPEDSFEDVVLAEGAHSPGGNRNFSDEGLQRYRVEVGRVHGVVPGHIVGAIANEANINSRDIGQIKIYHDFSLVDLPANLPPEIMRHLKAVWVCGQQLQLAPDLGPGSRQEGAPKRRSSGKPYDRRKGKPVKRKFPGSKRSSKKTR
jgi:ATP-dependent RNA helicase DeaD